MNTYTNLNAELNLYSPDGKLQLHKDKEAARAYFLENVNPHTMFFHDLEEKIHYMVKHDFWSQEVFDQYDPAFVKRAFKQAYGHKFRFSSFMGAYKFYTSYALRSDDGQTILERYEDRVTMTALFLARGDRKLALSIIDEIVLGRFQPATPTFQNAGKSRAGELVSCFEETALIETSKGLRPIKSIEAGDLVLTHDGSFQMVLGLKESIARDDIVTVKWTAEEGGEVRELRATPEHPILARRGAENGRVISPLRGDGDFADEKKWIAIGDLLPGDFLHLGDGYLGSVVEVGTEGLLKPTPVYNLEVEKNHTYVADGVVVHNCFLLRAGDSLDSIEDTWTASAQLSKIGGGVAIGLSNLRERGAPLKGKEGLAKGVISWMKIYENIFSTVDQLGTRPGAGAVYLSVHHPDIMDFLDCKRENADSLLRIKNLSTGVVIPDVTFELAKKGDDMYLFSPYDVQKEYSIPFDEVDITAKYDEMVNNANIRKKKVSARKLLSQIAELQFESGYPFCLFSDNANNANPIEGKIVQSNLCSEILQSASLSEYDEKTGETLEVGRDISCNLGSLNVYNAMLSEDFGHTIETSMRALTAVSDMTEIHRVPSIRKANNDMHSVGLGQMSLATYFATHGMVYGDEESLDFTNMYFMLVNYWTLVASNKIAKERKASFYGFERSTYATGEYWEPILNEFDLTPRTKKVAKLFADAKIELPTREDWELLRDKVQKTGLWHSYRQAVAPTGSISYITSSSPSILPVTSVIEIRKEGGVGRVYVPAPHLSDENREFYKDAFEVGPHAIIDVYAEATRWVDQGLSCTLHMMEGDTTRELTKAQLYAWKKGLKTLYYVRVRAVASGQLAELNMSECVSCAV